MKAHKSIFVSKKFRRGIGMAEALISLAITALLLTAVAAAFSASSAAIEMNDQFYRASRRHASALTRSSIRSAAASPERSRRLH